MKIKNLIEKVCSFFSSRYLDLGKIDYKKLINFEQAGGRLLL